MAKNYTEMWKGLGINIQAHEGLLGVLGKAYSDKADGVVHYEIQFCTPYAMESHAIRRAMAKEGVPFLRIETDYSMEDAAQLQTRVQAFIELLK